MRHRILLVTDVSPYKTDFGGRQRSHFMLRSLSEIGDVDVLILESGDKSYVGPAKDGRSVAEGTFKALGIRKLMKFSPDRELGRLLRNRLNLESYDVVCARYLGPVSKIMVPSSVPVIVDLDDVGFTYPAEPSFLKNVVAVGKTRVRHFLEQRAIPRFQRFWFPSARDRAAFAELPGGILSNIPIPPRQPPAFASAGTTILCVGALWYPPNRLGVTRFLKNCWPQIRAAVPQAQLRLIGPADKSERSRFEQSAGVQAPGFVPDLDEEYARAAFSVAPIYGGGGTNIKVLESLAHGRACVTTAFSLSGFQPHLSGTTDILASGSDEEIASNCIRLLKNPAEREALARTGHAIVSSNYTFENFSASVREQVLACIEARSRR